MKVSECCEWRNILLTCLSRRSCGTEYWDSLRTWIGLGEKDNKVFFSCQDCDNFYDWVLEAISKLKHSPLNPSSLMSCCQTIGVIRDVLGNPKMDAYGWWLSIYGKSMCSECHAKSKQLAIDTGFMKTVNKLMKEEYDRKFDHWWENTSDEDKAKEIVYMEYLREVNKNPKYQVEVWKKMNVFNPNQEQLKDYLLYERLHKNKH